MTRQLAFTAAVALAASLVLDLNRIAAQETDAARDESAAATEAHEAADAAAAQQAENAAEAQRASEAQQAASGVPAEGSAEVPPTAEESTAAPPATQPQSQQPTVNQSRTEVQGQVDLDRQAVVRSGVQFGGVTNQGLTVTRVEPNTAFFNSGIRQNDVLVSVDGRPIRSDVEFYRWVRPGVRVPVVVMRGGRTETIYVEAPQVAQLPAPQGNRQGGKAYLGITFDPQGRGAAIVQSVNPGSPGEQAGLQPGDAITALNNEPVQSHHDAIAIVSSMQPGNRLAIAFERRQQSRTETVLAARPGEPVRTAERETRSILVPAERPAAEVERRDLDGRPDVYIDRDIDGDRDRIDRRLDRAERRAIRRGVR